MAGKILGEPVNTIGTVLPKAASYREGKLSSLKETLARKVAHGKYGSQMRSENAFLWLSEGKVDARTSALLMAAQARRFEPEHGKHVSSEALTGVEYARTDGRP